jgi:hypothetical protein
MVQQLIDMVVLNIDPDDQPPVSLMYFLANLDNILAEFALKKNIKSVFNVPESKFYNIFGTNIVK